MSKAWELLKHLEEGGQLIQEYTSESRPDIYKMEGGILLYQSYSGNWVKVADGLIGLCVNTERYKLVVPKRKTVVEAWVDFGNNDRSDLRKKLNAKQMTFNPKFADDYEAKVRITLEEL